MKVLLILMAALGGASAAEPLHLCVAAGIDTGVRASWEQELQRIAEASGVELRFTDCIGQVIRVRFVQSSATEPTALGAAQVTRGRVQPALEIYTAPVADMIGTTLPGPLGKALARVTAHELRHYLAQEQTHHRDFAAVLNAGTLLAARPAHFRFR